MKIKICCISTIAEARMAIDAGADGLGFVSSMPSGPGVIDESLIGDIIASVPASIETFLLTSQVKASAILEQCHRLQPSMVQLVDTVSTNELEILALELGKTKIVSVVHVRNDNSVREAQSIEPFVDYLLLDSGNQALPVKELGGTGRTHNWSISRDIVAVTQKPVYLAGGLNAQNVAEAFRLVAPHGVDLCSGVRSDRKLDKMKLHRFIDAVRCVDIPA